MFRRNRPRNEAQTREERKKYVHDLYGVFFGRTPGPEESDGWIAALERGMSEREVFDQFKASEEYETHLRLRGPFPPGHYSSPIVDPAQAKRYSRFDRNIDAGETAGIRIAPQEMVKTWELLRRFIISTDFPYERDPRCRYYLNNDMFGIGDAAVLRAMIFAVKPRQIIEIGSGFSSACLLDALDELGRGETMVTFIEPYPERLFSLLRPSDRQRCRIIERPIQEVQLELFDEAGPDDMVIIDSSHILKTGSDVNFELFEVMPRLKNGVLIHFHDVFYSFEYPEAWIAEARSWNEIYALRAFLMYNQQFEILYFNSFFGSKYAELIEQTYPRMLENPGGSLWLKKMSAAGRS
jgi:predicted O-methyltransferase YrrM